jgi:hypothetical protein
MRRLLFLLPLTALLLPATAGAHRHARPESFSGTCSMSGTVHQDPPLTSTPQAGSAVARLAGTCTGTLTDKRGRAHQLDGARARYRAAGTGTVSCGGGTAAGRGTLRFGHGRRISFSFSEVRGPGAAALSLEGRAGGQATAEATVSQDEDPAAIALACAGAGLSEVGIDANLATSGISG